MRNWSLRIIQFSQCKARYYIWALALTDDYRDAVSDTREETIVSGRTCIPIPLSFPFKQQANRSVVLNFSAVQQLICDASPLTKPFHHPVMMTYSCHYPAPSPWQQNRKFVTQGKDFPFLKSPFLYSSDSVGEMSCCAEGTDETKPPVFYFFAQFWSICLKNQTCIVFNDCLSSLNV